MRARVTVDGINKISTLSLAIYFDMRTFIFTRDYPRAQSSPSPRLRLDGWRQQRNRSDKSICNRLSFALFALGHQTAILWTSSMHRSVNREYFAEQRLQRRYARDRSEKRERARKNQNGFFPSIFLTFPCLFDDDCLQMIVPLNKSKSRCVNLLINISWWQTDTWTRRHERRKNLESLPSGGVGSVEVQENDHLRYISRVQCFDSSPSDVDRPTIYSHSHF